MTSIELLRSVAKLLKRRRARADAQLKEVRATIRQAKNTPLQIPAKFAEVYAKKKIDESLYARTRISGG